MKLSLLKLTLLCFLILTTTAYSQQQGLFFNYFGGGARSEGMGEAFIAVSNDASAGGWNPAALYQHEQTFMGFSYSFLMPRGEYQFYVTPQRQLNYDHEGSVSGINNWSIITPMRIKGHPFVFNISTTRFFDVYYKFGEKIFPEIDLGNPDDLLDDGDPNTFMERTGGVNAVNLGFGTRLYKQLSFGLMANIYYGKVVTTETRDYRLDTIVTSANVTLRTTSLVYDSTNYKGFSFTLGFLYDAERFKAGLLARLPFTLKGESDSTIDMYTTLNGGEKDIPESPFRTQVSYVDNITSKTDMPLMLGFGLAYNVQENFLVAGDIEYRAFGNSKVNRLDKILITAGGSEVEETFTEYDPNWSDCWSMRLGAEYLFQTPIGEVPVRVGARKENLPEGSISNYEILYDGPRTATGVEHDGTRIFYAYEFADNKTTGGSISFGSGIHWNQILLDFAYTYSNYEQGIYTDGRIRSKNIWKNHHVNFSFTGYF